MIPTFYLKNFSNFAIFIFYYRILNEVNLNINQILYEKTNFNYFRPSLFTLKDTLCEIALILL
jgi:hypothetical protein